MPLSTVRTDRFPIGCSRFQSDRPAGLRFPVGTEVIVNGFLARSGEPVVNGRSVNDARERKFR